MELFYANTLKEETAEYTLTGSEVTHITKVFRKKVGQEITLTNGKGMCWTGTIITIARNSINLSRKTAICHPPLDYSLHIAIAPTKSNDRMEWFLEKATEIGVSHITPLLCEQSERKIVKPERWEKILISALKQSQRFHLPLLHPLTPFSEFITQQSPVLLAHCYQGEKTPLTQVKPQPSYTICIGPEGDFSTSEVAAALAKGAQAISLGNARYRTETAGIIGCHTIALNHENKHL